jgi:tetratricopeptide (TPR) repeat protein
MGSQSFDALWDYGRPGETETKFRALLPEYEAAGDPGPLAELLTQIARTLGLQQEFDEAHALLDRADALIAARARAAAGSAAGGAPLEVARVRSLLERGRVFNSAGARARAEPLFHEAYQAALALGADDYIVDAAHMLEIVETGPAKLEWNARAVAHAESSQDARARRWLGSLYNNRGWTLHELGRLDEALAMFEKRLAWLEQHPPADGLARHALQIGVAHWSIAKMFRLLGRVGEALEIQNRLLEAKSGADDGYVHEELAECLLALGREAEARPGFARAHALLSKDPWLVRHEPARLERLARLGGADREG